MKSQKKDAKKPRKKVIFLHSAASFFQQTHSAHTNIKADNRFQKCKRRGYAVASKHFAATTFETKKASKQVNRQDTLFTILCSVSVEEFDLFLLYIPQCHKHNAVSLSFKGPSVTGSGGKDQIFISKTQNGKFK